MKLLHVEGCSIKEAIVALGIYHHGHKMPKDGKYKVGHGRAYIGHISEITPNPVCRENDYIITRFRSELRVYDCNQSYILDTIGGGPESWGTVMKVSMEVLNDWLISSAKLRICDVIRTARLQELGFPELNFNYKLAEEWDGKVTPQFVRVWPNEEDEIKSRL